MFQNNAFFSMHLIKHFSTNNVHWIISLSGYVICTVVENHGEFTFDAFCNIRFQWKNMQWKLSNGSLDDVIRYSYCKQVSSVYLRIFPGGNFNSLTEMNATEVVRKGENTDEMNEDPTQTAGSPAGKDIGANQSSRKRLCWMLISVFTLRFQKLGIDVEFEVVRSLTRRSTTTRLGTRVA